MGANLLHQPEALARDASLTLRVSADLQENAMAEELEIEIAPDGKVTVRTKGIKGPECLNLAEVFVKLVGVEEECTKTSEYYETDVEVKQHVHQKQHRS